MTQMTVTQTRTTKSTATPTATEFSVAQLDAMLAPIALYPDDLLMQMLMAATFPVQIVSAARWLDKAESKALKGDALLKALEPENWDPSVKSLIPFQQVVRIRQPLLHGDEFPIWQHDELLLAVLAQDFGMQFQQASGGHW